MKDLFDYLFDRTAVQSNGCWEYTGQQTNGGYGKVWYNYKDLLAHRVSYDLCVGDIPKGMCVLHKCDNRICVNPKHLFLGTHKDNVQDCIQKGRRGSGRALLTVEEVSQIKRQLTLGVSHGVLATRYSVAPSTIGMISIGRNWSEVT